jgi:hypothetical protein
MARRSSTATKRAEPVFTWAFRSSQPRGGQFITYETRLEETGILRCNCPGWIFCRGDKSCKHTKMVDGEVKEIMRKFRAGEELPLFEDPNAPRVNQIPGIASPAPKADNSRIKYGRLIEL